MIFTEDKKTLKSRESSEEAIFIMFSLLKDSLFSREKVLEKNSRIPS